MSEIGSGSGSSYPGSLDTNSTPEVNSPNAGKTKARAEVPNDLAACVVAIETELGTDPAGTLADVKTFLQTEHATNGTHTTNVISEKTAGSGVTIDSVLCKDNTVTATTLTANTSVVTDTISEKTGAAGVTIDSCLVKDGAAAKANGLVTNTTSVVTGSRSFGTAYQNTSGFAMLVFAGIRSDSAGALFTISSDANSNPSTAILHTQNPGVSQYTAVTFLVQPSHYYKIVCGTGTPSAAAWVEVPLGVV